MTDAQRLEAFFQRLKADPDLATFAAVLGPYRTMFNAETAVLLVQSLADHWAATAEPVETKT